MTRQDYIADFRRQREDYIRLSRILWPSRVVTPEDFVAKCRSHVAYNAAVGVAGAFGSTRLTSLKTPADWCAVASELAWELSDRCDDLYSDPLP